MNPNSTSSKLILILLELIIPLIGFLFWKWDFVFIMLFFALDWFVVVLFQFVKINVCLKRELDMSDKRFIGLTAFIILSKFLGSLMIVIGVCYTLLPNFDLSSEFERFLSYKDSGMAQGYFLIPLCLLNGYLIYQRDFAKPKLYETKSIREIFMKSFTIHIVVFVICIIIAALAIYLKLSPEVLLYIALGTIFAGKVYFQILKTNP